ncbi:hypothetical protein [Corynebacterium timonense]|uniref:Lipoprotein n=1 Tax=Corynebacterium timonense TaxID=441500 RepID=A0A1H1MSW8_9CORY|nr:hypothetical protein [Corynebacterium timonense]SDR89475.1 hypothetical protein SAMN04488539_0594 [Corynebacterium timonense]
MLLSVPASRAAAAVSVAALAVSLAACGAEEDEAASGGLSTAAVPAADSAAETAAEDGADAPDEGKDGEKEKKDGEGAQQPQEGGGQNAAAGAPPTLEIPFGDGTVSVPVHEPLADGNPGGDADREDIERTMYAALNPESPDKWTRVLLENSCRKVTDQVNSELNKSGLTLDQVEAAARMQQQAGEGIQLPKSEVSVKDVRVNGNRASAEVTATSANGSETQTQIFEREDGRWKLCN